MFERNPDFQLQASEYPLPYLMLAEQCLGVQPESRPPLRQVKGSIQVRWAWPLTTKKLDGS